MARRLHRGFSLVELATVLAIIGILGGLSAVALSKMKSRGNFASATGDFVEGLRVARAEAYGRSHMCVVVVDTVRGRWWAIDDVNSDFSLGTFDPANAAPAGDILLASGTLPTGTTFGPRAGWGTALPPPLSGIPTGFLSLPDGGMADISTDGGTAAPNYKYCSFCDPATGYGAVTFLPSGGASFSGLGPLTIGQQVALQYDPTDGGSPSGIIDYAIVGVTGSIQAVTVK